MIRNRNVIMILFSLVLTVFGCTDKELLIDVVESKCNDFTISNLSYDFVLDPSCGINSNKAIIDVSFNFVGDEDCLDTVDISPRIFQSDNTQLYPSFVKRFGKDVFTISGNEVSFRLELIFNSVEEADSLNHVLVKLHTENEIGNKSNEIEFRINGSCSKVDESTYNAPSKTYNVSTSRVKVRFWDDASEDGDIISVYLNGKWVLENFSLTNAGQEFVFDVESGDNYLIVFAINEGEVGPNTVAMSIEGDQTDLSPDLLTGESVNISF